MEISGRTKICGLIGDPVEHSLSPTMHNAAFEKLGLDFVYVAFRVQRSKLRDAVTSIRSLGIHGLNVTMPHKNAIIKYMDKMNHIARAIGAVNTILNDDGKLVGYDTDGIGAVRALKESGIDLKGKKLLMIGAGGAGKAIAFHLAQEVGEIIILNRATEKAERLAKDLRNKFQAEATGGILTNEIIKKQLSDTDILINATSVGMHPDVNSSLIDPSWLRPDLCVMDIVYNPIETKLVRDAKSIGARVVYGIDMLVYQGAASFEIWINHQAPVEVMKKSILRKLSGFGVTVEGKS